MEEKDYGALIKRLNKLRLIRGEAFRKQAYEYAQGKLTDKVKLELDDLEVALDAPDRFVPMCSSCNTRMNLRNGKNGPFWGCPNYFSTQKCKSTKNINFTALWKHKRLNEPDFVDEKEVAATQLQRKQRLRKAKFGKAIRGLKNG